MQDLLSFPTMRADNDHAVGNSVEVCKDESKAHQCPEEKWEDAELKIPENGKKKNNVCELFYDTRSSDEWDKENDGNALECHSCGDSDEPGKKFRDDSHDLEKVDPVFYMDKNVTACDLPEIVVCYKENAYNVVKDICVDEGVSVQEKFLFGEKDSVKCSSNSDQCGSSEAMTKVNENSLETKSSEVRNSKVDDSELCEESSREDFADAEGSSNCNQEEDLIVREEVKNLPTQMLNPSDKVAISSENVLKEYLTLGNILSREEDEQKPLNNNNNSNRPEEQSPPQFQDEEKRSLENTEEKLSSQDSQPETENQQQNYLVDDKLFPSSFGETSFSAAEAVSGHITYSGPIAFSGSLSVRSDASTTSGRSFAFPILQSEWNTSPVRMAKPDKRRQKGWKHSLLCCRFS